MDHKRPHILLTGAAGFIGFHLQQALQGFAEVRLLDALVPHQQASVQRSHLISGLHTQISDSDLDQLLIGIDCIIHLAAETGIRPSLIYPERYFTANVGFTMRLLEAAKRARVQRLIYASSSSVYAPYSGSVSEDANTDQQLSFYGTTKKMMEQLVAAYAQQEGLRAIGLRFFTVYGSWTRPDMAAYKFMKAISSGQAITLYDPTVLQRDFTHVSDITDSILGLLQQIDSFSEGQHELFNIGFGSPVLVHDFAMQIASALNKPLFINPQALPSNEAISTHANTDKLFAILGRKPRVSSDQGVSEMVSWFRNFNYE